jgi:hypothetical protein
MDITLIGYGRMIVSRFKVGDKVICVDPDDCYLTKGKVYAVVNMHYGDLLDVQNDEGIVRSYFRLRFEPVTEKETEMNIDQEIAELEKTLKSLKDKKKEQDRDYPVGAVFDIGGKHRFLTIVSTHWVNLVSITGNRYLVDSLYAPQHAVSHKDLQEAIGSPFKYLGQCIEFKVKDDK